MDDSKLNTAVTDTYWVLAGESPGKKKKDKR